MLLILILRPRGLTNGRDFARPFHDCSEKSTKPAAARVPERNVDIARCVFSQLIFKTISIAYTKSHRSSARGVLCCVRIVSVFWAIRKYKVLEGLEGP